MIFDLNSRSPNLRLFASDRVILTTHRIRYQIKRVGYMHITSILLDQLASIQVTQTSNPVLLVLAFIAFIGGLFGALLSRGGEDSNIAIVALVAGIVVALLLVIVYYLSRREVLVLTAPNATIKIGLRRVGAQFTQKFIDVVEDAKNARYMIGKKLIQTNAT